MDTYEQVLNEQLINDPTKPISIPIKFPFAQRNAPTAPTHSLPSPSIFTSLRMWFLMVSIFNTRPRVSHLFEVYTLISIFYSHCHGLGAVWEPLLSGPRFPFILIPRLLLSLFNYNQTQNNLIPRFLFPSFLDPFSRVTFINWMDHFYTIRLLLYFIQSCSFNILNNIIFFKLRFFYYNLGG